MILRPTTGILKKPAGSGNRFAEKIISHYRRMGDYFYQGASLTFLKNETAVRQEWITRHPIYVTLQLLSQKIYLEQNQIMAVNRQLYREITNRRLAAQLEQIHSYYPVLYPEFIKLNRQIGSAATRQEQNAIQGMLKAQMRQLRGVEAQAQGREEQVLRRTEPTPAPSGDGQDREVTPRQRELRLPESRVGENAPAMRAAAGEPEELLAVRRQMEIQKTILREYLRETGEENAPIEEKNVPGGEETPPGVETAGQAAVEAVEKQLHAQQNLLEAYIHDGQAVVMQGRMEAARRSIEPGGQQAEAAEEEAQPALWRQYLEAVQFYQTEKFQSLDIEERTFRFLNTVQRGSLEEKEEFKKFLNRRNPFYREIKETEQKETKQKETEQKDTEQNDTGQTEGMAGQEGTAEREDSLTTLMQKNPGRLLEVLEHWQEAGESRRTASHMAGGALSEYRKVKGGQEADSIAGDGAGGILPEYGQREVKERQEAAEKQPAGDVVSSETPEYQDGKETDSGETEITVSREAVAEQYRLEGERVLREQLREQERLLERYIREIWKEAGEAGGREQTWNRQLPVLWKQYQEGLQAQMNMGKTLETEEKVFLLLNTIQNGGSEEKAEFKHFLGEESREAAGENLSALLQKEPGRVLELLEQRTAQQAASASDALPSRQSALRRYIEQAQAAASEYLHSQETVMINHLNERQNILETTLRQTTVSAGQMAVPSGQTTIISEQMTLAGHVTEPSGQTAMPSGQMTPASQVTESSGQMAAPAGQMTPAGQTSVRLGQNANVSDQTVFPFGREEIAGFKSNSPLWETAKQLIAQDIFPADNQEKTGERGWGVVTSTALGRTRIERLEEFRSAALVYVSTRTEQEQRELLRIITGKTVDKVPDRTAGRGTVPPSERTEAKRPEPSEINQTTAKQATDSRQAAELQMSIQPAANQPMENWPLAESPASNELPAEEPLAGYAPANPTPAEQAAAFLRRASYQELEEVIRRVTESLPQEQQEQLQGLLAVRQETAGAGSRLLISRQIHTFGFSHQEILDRPYSLVFQKRELTETVRRGSLPQLLRLASYMSGSRMLDRTELPEQNPEGIREVLYRQIHRLTEEQVREVTEYVVQDIRQEILLRFIETQAQQGQPQLPQGRPSSPSGGQLQQQYGQYAYPGAPFIYGAGDPLLQAVFPGAVPMTFAGSIPGTFAGVPSWAVPAASTGIPSGAVPGTFSEVFLEAVTGTSTGTLTGTSTRPLAPLPPEAASIIHKTVSKQEETIEAVSRRTEEILEQRVVTQQEETKRLIASQEQTAKKLTEQYQKLEQLKSVVEEQSVQVRELKRQMSGKDQERMYQGLMKRMERQLHLERQRRGMD